MKETSRKFKQFGQLGLIILAAAFRTSSAFNNRLLVPTLHPNLVSINDRRRPSRSDITRRKASTPFHRPYFALSYPGPTLDPWEEVVLQVPSHPHKHDDINETDKAVMAIAAGFVAVSLYSLMTMTSAGSWRYFLAGGICAATSHAIPTPLDVVKTRKQVDPELADFSFVQATRQIVKNEGFHALWLGLGPTVWGYLFEGALKFGIYEILKPLVKSSLSHVATITSMAALNSQLLAFVLCGTASGFAASIMLCPMEALRIRMVAEPGFAPNGLVQGGMKVLKSEGVGGLFKGINPMIMKQVPYTVTKNVSFDYFTRFLYAAMRAQGIALSAASMFAIPFVSAAVASVLSSISSQPGDMVLSLVNAHQGDRRSSDFFRSVLRSDRGVRGFFVGFRTRLMHVGMTVTLQLLIYDYAKRLCGIAATGTC